MKYLILCCMLLLINSASANSELEKVDLFAAKVLNAIASKDRERIKSLGIFPHKTISDWMVSFMLDRSEFFTRSGITIKIYGPYKRTGIASWNSYNVVYYCADKLSPQANGVFELDKIKEHWEKNYFEMVVIVVKGQVRFDQTVFYYGTHPPWEGDY